MFLFNLLVALLPARLQGAAKAVYPAIATIVGVGAQWVATGGLDVAELRTAAIGAATALLVFLIPNRPAPPA